MRSIIHLNFGWYFQKEFQKEHLEDYRNLEGFQEVALPHSNLLLPFNYLPEKINELISTYKKVIFFGKEFQGKILKLVFEGVAHACELYLNEKFLMRHEGGYTEFTVDITDAVVFNQENYLTVVVDNHENRDIPPFGGLVDYLGYGGIYREVQLLVLEPDYLKAVFLDNNDITSDELNFRITTSTGRGEFIVTVFEEKQQVLEFRQPVQGKLSAFSGIVKGKKLWTLDAPHLYDVRVQLLVDKEIKDSLSARFGFREVKFTKNGFYLNRELLKLRGLNRHQSYPYVGYALPKSAQEKDADILKYDLGVNIVRTSHYPQSRHFLNRCDEIGLLVFEEIPGWNYIGGAKFRENTLANVQAMIERDYNHPSIVIWGVRINESLDDTELYRATNQLAHKLDPTRPTGGVRNFLNSELLEDVYTYNDFLHSGKNEALREPDQVKKGAPYLVTEHNGHMFPTKRYDNEEHRIEHLLRHYRVMKKAAANPRISGAIGWCMCDYNTHDEFGSGDNTCYHGVLDMFRLPKPASYIYAAQQERKPMLEVLSSLAPGDYPMMLLSKIYVATNLDYLKVYNNDIYIGTFYPEKSSLPHPLIIIDDFIGNRLIENEKVSTKDSERIKKLFRVISEYGHGIPLRYKLVMFYLLKKYRWSIDKAVELYYKYHNPSGVYRFEGYRGEKPVKTVIREVVKATAFQMEIDSRELVIGETYDVTRVVISKVDQNGHVLDYAFDAFKVQVSGGIDLIGPDILALNGGRMAFWIKTNGTDKEGKITVVFSDQVLTENITIKGGEYENRG